MNTIPQVNITISSESVIGKKKKLKAVWKSENDQKLLEKIFGKPNKKELKKEIKLASKLVEEFLLTKCNHKPLFVSVPVCPVFKDHRDFLKDYFNGNRYGKIVVKSFLDKYIDWNKFKGNWNKFKVISINNIIDIIIDIIYKHNIDPFTIRVSAPRVESYSNFWNKHSERGHA